MLSDVNECATNNGGCSDQATCTNEAGSHRCECNYGYSSNDSGITCTGNRRFTLSKIWFVFFFFFLQCTSFVPVIYTQTCTFAVAPHMQ